MYVSNRTNTINNTALLLTITKSCMFLKITAEYIGGGRRWGLGEAGGGRRWKKEGRKKEEKGKKKKKQEMLQVSSMWFNIVFHIFYKPATCHMVYYSDSYLIRIHIYNSPYKTNTFLYILCTHNQLRECVAMKLSAQVLFNNFTEKWSQKICNKTTLRQCILNDTFIILAYELCPNLS